MLRKWATALGGSEIAAVQGADATYVSTTTLADTDLEVSVEKGTYILRLHMMFNIGAGGARYDLDGGTAGVTSLQTSYSNLMASNFNHSRQTSATTDRQIINAGIPNTASTEEGVVVFSSPGTFVVRAAQQASSAATTTLRSESYLILKRIADE